MARQCVVVAPDNSVSRWKQLPFGQTAGKNEAWLRDMLQAYPELIPVEDLDPTYGPLVPLCTELPTPAGRIDNVFINPRGQLTLVECKLWNNSEARRKVVAQILDYAKELGRWSATDLAARVASRRATSEPGLFELVREHHPSVSEPDFHDGVVRSLREGRFQLLVAGDGIREEVRGIADLINKNATSAFSFGLFQVELYEGPQGELLVQPRTVARTQLIERTVIVLQEGGQQRLESVDVPEDLPPQVLSSEASAAQTVHAAAADWWKQILSTPLLNQDQEPFRYYWPHNVRARLPWPGTWITAYRASSNSQAPRVGVFVSGRPHPLSELLRALQPEWEDMRSRLPAGTRFEVGGAFGVDRPLATFADEGAAKQWLLDTMNQFVNEVRPQAAALAGQ